VWKAEMAVFTNFEMKKPGKIFFCLWEVGGRRRVVVAGRASAKNDNAD
jgi:hypothetical protein